MSRRIVISGNCELAMASSQAPIMPFWPFRLLHILGLAFRNACHFGRVGTVMVSEKT